ncbi:MAG TPA: hypothetical protein VGP92_18435 [Acidimicrobiia bacterium]|nr:hypothetical protein [Acidimicrobiia bacterium]
MREMLRGGFGRRLATLGVVAATGATAVTVGLVTMSGAGATTAHHFDAHPAACIARHHHRPGHRHRFHHGVPNCEPSTSTSTTTVEPTTTTVEPTTTTTVASPPTTLPCLGVIINGICFFSP